MATNKSMVEALERMHFLQGRLKKANMEELVSVIEEITAWNSVLNQHILAQKKATQPVLE